MDSFISELKAAWVGNRRRKFYQSTRGIMTPEERQALEDEFERKLAARDAEVAAKAWDEGREAEELAWEHAFNGHPVPEGEVCDECKVVNPYRKAVEQDD